MAYYIYRSVLPSRLVTRQVMFLQPQKFALRNSNPVLFQSSLSRSYTNSIKSPPPNTPSEESTSSSNLNKYLGRIGKGYAKRLPTAILAKIIVTVLVGSISVDLLYAWYRNRCNERLLNKTVEKGTRPDIGISSDKFVPRPEIVKRLKEILQPYEDQSSYYMVCGEHGTGKTTLTRIASSEVGNGVIYVDIPPDFEVLGETFGKAINFAFEEKISITEQLGRKILGITKDKPEISEWKRAMRAFKRASTVYKAKYGKPPVIVYDNVSRLVHKNPEILDILQDDAKDNADDRKYIAVFVSSEGSVPRRMESRSSWSRADKPVMEIGDLSKEESINYLVDKRKIKKEEAIRLYELVGGRIVDLKSVADKSLAKQPFEVIKQSILGEVEKKFNTAQLLRKQLHHEVGKKAIKALFDSKELGFTTFMEFFNDYEEASKVLETNIFAYHPEKNTVSFQSQSVECYIREKADIFIK
ncbi:1328_t:CDS:2 [Funneliformis geosporum]|uniref:11994_t:CDS:1 n=1 Tax=Funneliformis geosporum TaxID=1117311 RepID=A0A9W4SUE9_9GLOM|nr:11994_t:CDS:2 [Funneliformis geosporum]CAI2187281.1 1328_t:CDS:2 [Funneliformis geosporum]